MPHVPLVRHVPLMPHVPHVQALYGVFVRDGPGGLNLEPDAWAHHKKANGPAGSPYPAQVRFKCPLPRGHVELPQRVWSHIPSQQKGKFGQPIFDLWMDGAQANALAKLFVSSPR